MHTKSELLDLLRARGLRLTKRLGQHYLVDPRLTTRLVSACGLTARDTVIEIGAGLGALTDLLAASAGQVIAVEVDRAVCQALKERMAAYPNVEVRCQDILSFPWAQQPGCRVVGAMPYLLTSPILVMLAERPVPIADAWLGMQREVADRLTARPGTKAYGRLTILVQYRFTVEQVLRIPRQAFFPPPAVESAWVHLTPRPAAAPTAVGVADERVFFDVVRAAFSQRRKTLLNCLGQLASVRVTRQQAQQALEAAGLPADIRGEALSLEEFAGLANVVNQRGQSMIQ